MDGDAPYDPDHRTVCLLPDSVMVDLDLDLVAGRIVFVEIVL